MQRIVLFLIATMTMVTMNSQTFESLNSPWPKGEPNPYGKYFIGQNADNEKRADDSPTWRCRAL